ncbi:rCG51620, partial [Rattus norvegicus]
MLKSPISCNPASVLSRVRWLSSPLCGAGCGWLLC